MPNKRVGRPEPYDAPDRIFEQLDKVLVINREKIFILCTPTSRNGFFFSLWMNHIADETIRIAID